VKGKPVAYTKLRSTYFHEADSALGFSDFNNPNAIKSPRDFQRAASRIGFTFNWFYTDPKNIAYFNSGNNPVRSSKVSANFPVSGRFHWKGFNPGPEHRPLHALQAAPAGDQPVLPGELEQQAGEGLPGGGRQTSRSARSSARARCRTASSATSRASAR